MLHETGILPPHQSKMIHNMCKRRMLNEYLKEKYGNSLSLHKHFTQVEYMVCLHNKEDSTDGYYEFLSEMKFDQILHTIEHKKL